MLNSLKKIVTAATASVMQGDSVDPFASFPIHDSFHADCTMVTTFEATCGQVYESLSKTISSFKDPASGAYTLVEQQGPESTGTGKIWAQRETPTAHYVDDILFNIATNPSMPAGVCNVFAHSRSETMSFGDANTNYCNVWNVFRSQNLKFAPVVTKECMFVPDDALTTCDKY